MTWGAVLFAGVAFLALLSPVLAMVTGFLFQLGAWLWRVGRLAGNRLAVTIAARHDARTLGKGARRG